MNKTFKTIAMIAVMAVAAVSAQASVTYSGVIANAMDDAGNAIFDGTLVLVMDLDGFGWDGIGYDEQAPDDGSVDNASSWMWDADDYVEIFPIVENQGFSVAQAQSIISDFPATYDAGVDNWYLMWFATGFDATSDGPGVGVAYGTLLAGQLLDNGKTATYSNYAPGMATLVTVPEPASMLVLLGGSVLALRRRRA